jgi:hypothetical protein
MRQRDFNLALFVDRLDLARKVVAVNTLKELGMKYSREGFLGIER